MPNLRCSLLPTPDTTAPVGHPIQLVRKLDIHAQVCRKRDHGCGVLQERLPRQHDVRLALVEDLLRELARLDPSDSAHEDAVAVRFLHGLSEVRLVRVRDELELLARVDPPGRDVDEVDAVVGGEPGEADGVVELPGWLVRGGLLEPVRRRQPVFR